ncbi:hypothetical protein [Dyella sp. 2HG41-7]|uniref:hypothetical protein n=1 Tax=Dyella sp. 2HG41-7 TaxID=2883239 RepID=UPI001F3129A2|nr:hypothetical protein [Dyella sp. 2HG41-7]
MNKLVVFAISMVFVSAVHAQAASHAKPAPRINKAPTNASVIQSGAPASSTNPSHAVNTPSVRGNGAPACFQGSATKDNPTTAPCRHVKTSQI